MGRFVDIEPDCLYGREWSQEKGTLRRGIPGESPIEQMWLVAQPKHRFFHWGEFCQGRFADIAPLLLVKINSIQNYSIVQRTLADKDVISFLQHLNEEIQSLIRVQIGSTGFSSQSNSYLVFISRGVGMAVLTQEG